MTDHDKSKEELVQRARSFTARAAAALAALAIAPAVASAAPGTVDRRQPSADFSAGTPGTGTEIVAPGSVQLELTPVREEFDGTDVPAGMTQTPWEAGGGRQSPAATLW